MEVHLKKYAYKGLILIWLAMNLSGCATPYASSAGNYLGGFSEVQLGEDMFQVSFKGNAYTKADTVANYTLLRSAELTLQHGFTHFIVVDKADLSLSGSFTTPTSSSTTGSASIFGNTISGSSTTQFYGGQTFSFKKPGASNTIVCFNGKPQIGGVVYDAAFLVKSLKARYQISSSAISASIPSSQQSSGTSSQSVVQTSEQETGSSSNTTSTTTLTWEDGSRYVGEVLNNLPHGHGTLTIAYGGKYLGEYVGEFKDNKMHGQGTFTWANGNKYVGEYKDGEMHGQGTYTVPDGSGYVGEWKYDQPHGQGTETYADGDKYIGEFKDGEMHGQGTYTWPDGNKYVGEHKDGDKHGQGTYTFADGRTDSGEWRNGQLVSKKGLEETQPKAQSSVNEDEQENRSTEESFVTQSKATDVKSLYSANNDDEIYIFFGRSSSDVRKHLERNYLKDCTLKAGEFSVCDTRFFDRSKQSQFFVETRGVGGVTVQRTHGFQGENYLGLKVHISGVSKFLLAAIDQQVRRVKTQRLDLQVLLETPNSGEVILWFGHDLEALNDSLFDYDKPAGS